MEVPFRRSDEATAEICEVCDKKGGLQLEKCGLVRLNQTGEML
jgi:hypothetical protein